MKKLLLLCILVCFALVFASCANNNNVDASDDGIVDGKDTADKLPNEMESNVGGEKDTTDKGNEQTTDDKKENETEAPSGDITEPVGTKTISSDTGTGLNLVIEYTVGVKRDGMRNVDVVVYLESYSLNVTARGNTNYVKVGDETFYFSTESISYGGTAKTRTKLAEHTFTTNTNNSTLPIYAMWNFNGVYSQKPISAIVIENTIEL